MGKCLAEPGRCEISMRIVSVMRRRAGVGAWGMVVALSGMRPCRGKLGQMWGRAPGSWPVDGWCAKVIVARVAAAAECCHGVTVLTTDIWERMRRGARDVLRGAER